MAQHTIHTLNGDGDVRLTWDDQKPDEQAEARKLVDELKAKGYSFFLTDSSTPAGVDDASKTGELVARRVDDPVAAAAKDIANKARGRRRKADNTATSTVAVQPQRGG